MSLAKIEIVMDGHRPVRTLVEDADGKLVEIPGVTDISAEVGVADVPRVTVSFLAEVTIRKAFPEELE